jgi:choline dehydrogenase-like flavoprotein
MAITDSAEVIIVGSGAGGAAAAYGLARAGVRVLLLEKGAPLPRDGSTLDDRIVVSTGHFLSQEAWRDGKGRSICPEEHFNVGGKTKWYGAAVLRYSAEEFAPAPSYAAPGWPITLDELIPYYEEAEALLDVRTFETEPALKRILDALTRHDAGWKSQPLPLALAPQILDNAVEARHFDGFASVLDLKGEAQSRLLKRIAALPNFTLRPLAEVVALLPAAAGGGESGGDSVAVGVGGVRLASGEELRAPRVILAAGTLHSPRLLQRYVAGRAGFQWVGRNLKKHVLTAMVAVTLWRPRDVLRKTQLTTHADYPHSSVQPLGFDSELIAMLVPRYVPRFLARIIGRHAYGFFLQTEDGAHADNRVYERAPSAVGGAPTRVMDYDVARTPASCAEHRAFTRKLRSSLLHIGMISFTQPVGLNGTAHVSGTLQAGADADTAVVDRNGAVFGVEGLYVADGSILPRSSRVNPSLSIYAWGLRLGAFLASRIVAERTV